MPTPDLPRRFSTKAFHVQLINGVYFACSMSKTGTRGTVCAQISKSGVVSFYEVNLSANQVSKLAWLAKEIAYAYKKERDRLRRIEELQCP